ncbi:TonB-linked outer membrane protein, SusC/RagA family [compost metagenome]
MYRLNLFFLCLLLTTVVKAQNLQGKIIDELSHEPIPFVSVGIVGTNMATVSNENGEFIIKAEKLPVSLRFGHVSYLQLDMLVTTNQQLLQIQLSPSAIKLGEVTVIPEQGRKLLGLALKKAQEKEQESYYAKAFYRQLTTNNGKATEIHELFYDVDWNVKYIQGWAAKQSRFAEVNDRQKFSLNNQSFLTFALAGYLFPDKKNTYVSQKYLDLYTIKIDRYIEKADQDIAVITCKLNRPVKNRFYINSTYYIGTRDHQIYRLENQIFHLAFDFSPGLTLKYPPVVSTIATFKPVENSIPILESMATKMYLNLISSGMEIQSVISSLLTVFKIDDQLKNQQFRSLNSNVKDKTVIESIKYDASFWKDNPIVKQTALENAFIQMMESKQAFGTMINP